MRWQAKGRGRAWPATPHVTTHDATTDDEAHAEGRGQADMEASIGGHSGSSHEEKTTANLPHRFRGGITIVEVVALPHITTSLQFFDLLKEGYRVAVPHVMDLVPSKDLSTESQVMQPRLSRLTGYDLDKDPSTGSLHPGSVRVF
jgi:hypothetical protein